MTQAQVASRWEPRSPWLLGWKVVRDFPACGAFSAMPMLLGADPTSTCFLPMATPRKAEATAPAVSPECGPEAGRRCFSRRRRGGASAESGAVLGEWESRRSTCAAAVWERLNFGGGLLSFGDFLFLLHFDYVVLHIEVVGHNHHYEKCKRSYRNLLGILLLLLAVSI